MYNTYIPLTLAPPEPTMITNSLIRPQNSHLKLVFQIESSGDNMEYIPGPVFSLVHFYTQFGDHLGSDNWKATLSFLMSRFSLATRLHICRNGRLSKICGCENGDRDSLRIVSCRRNCRDGGEKRKTTLLLTQKVSPRPRTFWHGATWTVFRLTSSPNRRLMDDYGSGHAHLTTLYWRRINCRACLS